MRNWVYVIQREDEVECFDDPSVLLNFLISSGFCQYESTNGCFKLLKNNLKEFSDDLDKFESIYSLVSFSLKDPENQPLPYRIMKKYIKQF